MGSEGSEEVKWTFSTEFPLGGELKDALRAEEDYEKLNDLSSGRERVEKMRIKAGGTSLDVVVKTFRRPRLLQRIFSFGRPSKARRAFSAAEILCKHGVGTPPAVALRERFVRGKLKESKLICEFIPDMTDMRRELNRLFADGVNAPAIAQLLETIANACRNFHESGIIHRDLGNQNIGLRKDDAGKWKIYFMDLDRVRIFPAGTLSWRQRGRDLSRLYLPSELRWSFCHMYCGFYPVPKSFRRAVEVGVRAFAWDNHLRIVRHPIWGVKRKLKRFLAPHRETPLEGRGRWLWDERSVQALPLYDAKDSRTLRPSYNIFKIVQAWIIHGNAIRKNYHAINKLSFSKPVDFTGKIGMSLEADPTSWDMQLRYLSELEGSNTKLPILLRVYHHKGPNQWRFVVEKAVELRERGNSIAFALVQDREAVRDTSSWSKMVFSIVEKTHDFADFYEIGHATNRVKWGIWDFRDYTQKLLEPVLEIKRKFPDIKLTGPACIDFDIHNLPGILQCIPEGHSPFFHNIYMLIGEAIQKTHKTALTFPKNAPFTGPSQKRTTLKTRE